MKILLVDDDIECLESLRDALELLNHRTLCYYDPVQAVAEYRNHSCDVVLTDYKMPGMNGIELLRAIRKVDTAIPIIIISGFVDEIDAEKARKYGAYCCFPKPLDFELLLETLNEISA